MKAWLLVGHRGVGKSTLLRKLSQEFSDSQLEFFSLDREVEKYAQKSISKIFEEDGEKRFRSLEKEVLKKLVTENRVIDIGAGFEGPVPSNSRVLWVKRRIDSSRSQFLNRPGLDGSLILSRQRFSDRERCYRQWSQVSVFLREGEEFFGYGEKQFFKTLFLENENSGHLQNWFWTLQEGFSLQQIRILKQLGLKHFEWRDDMLTHRPDVEPIL